MRISDGKVVGLSKLARTVEVYTKASADPGTVDGTDRRCIDGIFKAAGAMVMLEAGICA